MRRILLTTSCDVQPAGLSTTITPFIDLPLIYQTPSGSPGRRSAKLCMTRQSRSRNGATTVRERLYPVAIFWQIRLDTVSSAPLRSWLRSESGSVPTSHVTLSGGGRERLDKGVRPAPGAALARIGAALVAARSGCHGLPACGIAAASRHTAADPHRHRPLHCTDGQSDGALVGGIPVIGPARGYGPDRNPLLPRHRRRTTRGFQPAIPDAAYWPARDVRAATTRDGASSEPRHRLLRAVAGGPPGDPRHHGRRRAQRDVHFRSGDHFRRRARAAV